MSYAADHLFPTSYLFILHLSVHLCSSVLNPRRCSQSSLCVYPLKMNKSSNKGKPIILSSSHNLQLTIFESISKRPVSQEMKALLFVVGKLVPRILFIGHGKLPGAEWFEPIMNTYNEKVERKMTAKELRRRIADKLKYIRRREREGKEPWYK